MANDGVAPPDLTTKVGLVRNYVGDTDPTNVTGGMGTYLWYSDAEITAFLGEYRQNARRVAIRIMRQLAFSQSMLLKKWTSADLAVDGPAVTAAILKAADGLEKEADDEDGASGIDASFQIVPTGGIDYLSRGMRWPHHFPERWL